MSYLAYIRDTSIVLSSSLDSIHVVYEFIDVFPMDLPSMPLNQYINLDIDVEPGTKPFYISPYRMAPVELKKLKDQLQKLLDKGFI